MQQQHMAAFLAGKTVPDMVMPSDEDLDDNGAMSRQAKRAQLLSEVQAFITQRQQVRSSESNLWSYRVRQGSSPHVRCTCRQRLLQQACRHASLPCVSSRKSASGSWHSLRSGKDML